MVIDVEFCLIKILLVNASEAGLSSSYSSHDSGVSMPVTIPITSSSVSFLQVNDYLSRQSSILSFVFLAYGLLWK